MPSVFFFFFNDTATTEIYTLSLHDALPIYRFDPVRRPVLVLDGDLRLSIRAQEGKRSILTGLREAARQPMRERDGQRHELGRLATREADHHALVAGALQREWIVLEGPFALFQRMVHARRNIGRLLLQIHLDERVVCVETDLLLVVADSADRVADRALDVELGVRGDLPDDHTESLRDRGLAGHARVTVLSEHAIEYGVGNLVANLVRMALGYRFGRQQERATTVKDHIGPREPARGARALPIRHRYVGSNTMKRLAVLLALVLVQACDAPWAGPTLPDGGHWVSFNPISYEGPRVITNDIFAASTTAELESAVLAFETSRHPGYRLDQACPAPCWGPVPASQPGLLYLAVATMADGCGDTRVKEGAAMAGRTLYFIHWVGVRSGSRCLAAQDARWRLLSVSTRDLPGSGTLTVRLQLQGSNSNANAAEGRVDLT